MLDSKEFSNLISQVESLVSEVRQLNTKGTNCQDSFPEEGQSNLLTPKQLAKKLDKSLATIYAWRKRKLIKAHKMGRSTYFDYQEVLAVVKS